MVQQAMSSFAPVLWLSSLAPTKRLSSSAPLIPFELCSRGRRTLLRQAALKPCSSALGFRQWHQSRDLRALLLSSLSNLTPGAVEPFSGRHCRALLLWPQLSSLAPTRRSSSPTPIIPVELYSRSRSALLRQALSSLAPVPSVFELCSNQAIVVHCSDHPCRALLQGPLSPAPSGTVELCSGALSYRALLQLIDRQAQL